MSSATLNGRAMPRRSLNDSIGKLDTILDGLGEAIPSTIRETLQQSIGDAVAAGVKAALVEVMTNPEVLARLHPQAEPVQPSFLGRLVAKVRSAVGSVLDWVAPKASALKDRAAGLKETAVNATGTVRKTGGHFVNRLRWLASCRRPIAIALTFGLVLAGFAYIASPACASVIAGTAATVSALGVQFALWARRTMNRLLMA